MAGLMYGLLSVDACRGQLQRLLPGRIGWVEVMKFTPDESVAFGGPSSWAFYYLYLPASTRSVGQLLALESPRVVTGWLLAFMFRRHVVGEVHFFKLNAKRQLKKGGAGAAHDERRPGLRVQVLTHFSGNLNYPVNPHSSGVCPYCPPAAIIKAAASTVTLPNIPNLLVALGPASKASRRSAATYVPSLNRG